MHRSGINAIGRWLLRQSPLKDKEISPICGDWIEGIHNYSYISQINHPEHFNYKEFITENTVATIERESIDSIGIDGFTTVILIREYKNWLASVLKSYNRVLIQQDMRIVMKDIRKYVSIITNKEGLNVIHYDKWCVSSDYRKGICKKLDLTYTNAGFKDVSSNGGGSSFDGIRFDGKADKMNTLDRWKEYQYDDLFIAMLDAFPDVIRLSDKEFRAA